MHAFIHLFISLLILSFLSSGANECILRIWFLVACMRLYNLRCPSICEAQISAIRPKSQPQSPNPSPKPNIWSQDPNPSLEAQILAPKPKSQPGSPKSQPYSSKSQSWSWSSNPSFKTRILTLRRIENFPICESIGHWSLWGCCLCHHLNLTYTNLGALGIADHLTLLRLLTIKWIVCF